MKRYGLCQSNLVIWLAKEKNVTYPWFALKCNQTICKSSDGRSGVPCGRFSYSPALWLAIDTYQGCLGLAPDKSPVKMNSTNWQEEEWTLDQGNYRHWSNDNVYVPLCIKHTVCWKCLVQTCKHSSSFNPLVTSSFLCFKYFQMVELTQENSLCFFLDGHAFCFRINFTESCCYFAHATYVRHNHTRETDILLAERERSPCGKVREVNHMNFRLQTGSGHVRLTTLLPFTAKGHWSTFAHFF